MGGHQDSRRQWSSWRRIVIACGLAALCVSILLWGVSRVMTLVGPVLGVTVILGTIVAMSGAPRDAEDAETHRVVWCCEVVAACVSIVLCVAVAAVLSRWWVLLGMLMLVITAPPVRDALSCRFRRRDVVGLPTGKGGRPASASRRKSHGADEAGGQTMEDEMASAVARVAQLDTLDLCYLWRATYWTVRQAQSPRVTAQVVELRQAVLEELERRRPDAVAAWIASGRHRADPASYL